jgi:DNA-binding MarR family transcriptional regulator
MLENLNKAFESRLRLGIMSVLAVNDWMDFASMKEFLGATDGNLSSHASALEKDGYLEVRKEFVGKKPKTSYRITHSGRVAFNEHLDALEELLKKRN